MHFFKSKNGIFRPKFWNFFHVANPRKNGFEISKMAENIDLYPFFDAGHEFHIYRAQKSIL